MFALSAGTAILAATGAAGLMYFVGDVGDSITMKRLKKKGLDPKSEEGKKFLLKGKVLTTAACIATGTAYYQGMSRCMMSINDHCLEEVREQLRLEQESTPPVVTEVIDGVEITTF